MLVLAGDAGGTNTRLALFESGANGLGAVAQAKFASREHASLSEMASAFLAQSNARPERAAFGIAGPVKDGRVRATNLPWEIDAREVAASIGLPGVLLMNDLEANAWGLRALPDADFLTLQEGDPAAHGNQALISAGTGLGEAGLFWDGRRHVPFACEGGHASFAARGDLEAALHAHLALEFGHVSWERVLSGPGLANVHAFLRRHHRAAEPAWLAEELRGRDPAAAITAAALSEKDAICAEALDLFVALYGSEAGNLALKMMATGGLFVGGGIAPKILSRLRSGGFLAAFLDKGRMRPLLESMPVRIVVNDRTALLGAAWRAAHDETDDAS